MGGILQRDWAHAAGEQIPHSFLARNDSASLLGVMVRDAGARILSSADEKQPGSTIT